jgi:uncharacterized protein YjgD (DUF1641 family)
MSRDAYQKASQNLETASGRFAANETPENQQKYLETHQDWKKARKSLEDLIDQTAKSDVFDFIKVVYIKYIEFLDGLTQDKIVCVFNILLGSVTLSSFFSVLSIMLSENIINRLTFLEKYPRIMKLLKLRNFINKKVAKFHLFMHFLIILLTLLGNIVMFFA